MYSPHAHAFGTLRVGASIDASASCYYLLAVVHIQLQPQFQQCQVP